LRREESRHATRDCWSSIAEVRYIIQETGMDDEGNDGGRIGRGLGNVPFEFVGEVASAGAVAEAGDVERGTTAAKKGWSQTMEKDVA
jgi:hypothetical protein